MLILTFLPLERLLPETTGSLYFLEITGNFWKKSGPNPILAGYQLVAWKKRVVKKENHDFKKINFCSINTKVFQPLSELLQLFHSLASGSVR